jgi:hypothetical protein
MIFRQQIGSNVPGCAFPQPREAGDSTAFD